MIVEDETRIARRIERMTREILGADLLSLTHINTLEEATAFIEKHSLDLILLDLNLNGANGFDLLTTAVSGPFHTIVVSAYKDQAINAFEHGVLDFVPKPFNLDSLAHAFNRYHAKAVAAKSAVKYLAVKKRQRVELVPVEDLVYFKGAGAYAEQFLSDGRKELHDKSMEKLEQLLAPDFERVHKSYLVKMTEVKGFIVQTGSKYSAELKNGERIPVGRTKYKDLKERWV